MMFWLFILCFFVLFFKLFLFVYFLWILRCFTQLFVFFWNCFPIVQFCLSSHFFFSRWTLLFAFNLQFNHPSSISTPWFSLFSASPLSLCPDSWLFWQPVLDLFYWPVCSFCFELHPDWSVKGLNEFFSSIKYLLR